MASNSLTLGYTPAHSLFKRCLLCPPGAPACPTCKSDEVCNQRLGDCDSCPSAVCVKTSSSGTTSNGIGGGKGGTNIGAIVGSVIGGVVVIAVSVFLIWKYWLKGRRHEVEEEWDDPDYPLEKPDNSVFRDARSSTHTVASMASTVLTRASNIIQIAYIPGVTNRTGSSSPGLLVPPVPPIPIPTTPSTTNSQYGEQHFFVPGDLRDSTYSDASSVDGRRPGSIASSLARNSVASTVYRDSAVLNPMPAKAVMASKAAIVSVKSNPSQASSPALTGVSSPLAPSSSSTGGNSPRPVQFKMPASSDNPKKGSGGNVQTMKPVALNIVKKGSKLSTSESASDVKSSPETTPERHPEHVELGLRPLTEVSMASGESESPGARARRSVTLTLHTGDSDDSDDELEAHERSRRSLVNRDSTHKSPFTDEAEAPKTPTTPSAHILQKQSPKAKNDARGKSPFDDKNAL